MTALFLVLIVASVHVNEEAGYRLHLPKEFVLKPDEERAPRRIASTLGLAAIHRQSGWGPQISRSTAMRA